MINNGSDELKVNLFVTIFFIPKLLFQRHHDKQRLLRLARLILKVSFFKVNANQNLRLADFWENG